jgi:hypothetical protein
MPGKTTPVSKLVADLSIAPTPEPTGFVSFWSVLKKGSRLYGLAFIGCRHDLLREIIFVYGLTSKALVHLTY